VYFALFSSQTGWASNDDFYCTTTGAVITGTWSCNGNVNHIAPVGSLTWDSQSSAVTSFTGSQTTTYVYFGDRWCDNCMSQSTLVILPLTVGDSTTSPSATIPTFEPAWILDTITGTWTGVAADAGGTSVDDTVHASGITLNEIFYSGSGWSIGASCSGCYDSSVSSASTTNDYALFQFSGTRVKIFTVVGTTYGFAGVSICNAQGNNCGTETLVDLFYQTGTETNHITWISPVLSSSVYTVKWRVTGGKHPRSSGYTVSLDRMVYY